MTNQNHLYLVVFVFMYGLQSIRTLVLFLSAFLSVSVTQDRAIWIKTVCLRQAVRPGLMLFHNRAGEVLDATVAFWWTVMLSIFVDICNIWKAREGRFRLLFYGLWITFTDFWDRLLMKWNKASVDGRLLHFNVFSLSLSQFFFYHWRQKQDRKRHKFILIICCALIILIFVMNTACICRMHWKAVLAHTVVPICSAECMQFDKKHSNWVISNICCIQAINGLQLLVSRIE